MADSLRDQLLKMGLAKKAEPKPSRGAGAARKPRPAARPAGKQPPQAGGEPDLAQAWAARARTEAAERKLAEQAAAEAARQKRERKQKIQNLLAGRPLAQTAGEHMRHFSYGGKIRRVYVDAAQLKALNTGELGVVQQQGRYLLVERAIALEVQTLEPKLLALLVDPDAPAAEDDGVPDDLIW